jgi:hypothetical protein
MLSLNELRRKTEEAEQRIRRERFASPEEIAAFFQDLQKSDKFRDLIKTSLIAATNDGKYDTCIQIDMPERMIRSLICGTMSWKYYVEYEPSYSKFFSQLFGSITEARISKIDVRYQPSPTLWVTLNWYSTADMYS